MNKLILIDGNAIVHRAYHALPTTLTTKDGAPINAVYGFVSILLRLITEFNPTHIAVAFDTPKPTFRHSEYVGYQSKRPRMDSDLGSQFAIAYKVLKAMNIPIYKLEGYEADDMIGTIAFQATEDKKLKTEIIIVTGDRDILQLVDKNVRVYMPTKGIEGKLYAESDVKERMGVAPNQIVDFKSLAGDSSDNYPGVPGIGPKTAVNLITKFDNLENVYKNLSEIPERVSKKLAIGAESAGMSKRLATIVRDAPITFHLKDAGNWDVDNADTLKLFEHIGFKTLTKRVKEIGEKIDKEKQMKLI